MLPMTRLAPLAALLLAGCGGMAPRPTDAPGTPAAGVVAGVGDETVQPTARVPLSTAMLPSQQAMVRVKTASPLLQRPTASSMVLRELPAGETLRLLGEIGNADGRWLSVGTGDMQGWLRAEHAAP